LLKEDLVTPQMNENFVLMPNTKKITSDAYASNFIRRHNFENTTRDLSRMMTIV
jgi:hypothetical protein